ncbi:MAG: uroporphyrinogen decarboxylase family protein [bacterium]|nr:uroporphyrinogen decarboxylase family protein [bacterium]
MKDILSKRERVERTLNFLPVDRVAIHEQVSHNPVVISLYTGKKIESFNYTIEDICVVIGKTLDVCFPPVAPRGIKKTVTEDGFTMQYDNWTSWCIKRPFHDTKGLKEYYLKNIEKMKNSGFDQEEEREKYEKKFLELQKMIGDDTVIIDYSYVGLEPCWTKAGIDLFTYLYYDEPEIISEWLTVFVENEIKRVHAIADKNLSPVILAVSDLASKIGPIFSPEFLRKEHFPHLKRLVETWHSHGFKVIYHSDGNYKILIDDFLRCEVDGFYCLEPACGMDIIELKKKYPKVVWAGGLDGVDLMERGTPENVRREVRRQIEETDALNTGGLFLGTSSEINPPIKVENYQAMIEEARSISRDF